MACGVAHVAASPGSRSTPMTVAADRTDGLEVSMHLDERSGGFFALGLARATGRPVAVLCTSGTAAANYMPAVVEAFHSGVPLLVLTSDRPPELQGRGAPQTVD
ncbi:MAG: thiamine pyrophosphate-binding protein, partial [Actinomycetota bacterium]|nr:thiamine pyrophosphate-binding protein [Actinomycetota bacterium]